MRSLAAVATTLAAASALATARAAGPDQPAQAAWTAYVAGAEARVERELADGRRFLALDFGATAAADRRLLLAGEVIVRQLDPVAGTGRDIAVPSAMVHHWIGAVFVPGLALDALMRSLQSDVPDLGQADVLQARMLERGPGAMKVFLKLQRSRFVTVVFNTEHLVQFRRHGPGRASSASTALRIAELEAPGTPAERERPPGEDRGFLWRWNAYWRYEQAAGGVLIECESISLSRQVPFGLRTLVAPLIRSTARESMERTLTSMRGHFRSASS